MPKKTQAEEHHRSPLDHWPPQYRPIDVACPRCTVGDSVKCQRYDQDTGHRTLLDECHPERIVASQEAPEHAVRGYNDALAWRGVDSRPYSDEPWKASGYRQYVDGWWKGRRVVVGKALETPADHAELKAGDWLVFPIEATSTVGMLTRLDRAADGTIVSYGLSGDSAVASGSRMPTAAYLPEAAWAAQPGMEHVVLPEWIKNGIPPEGHGLSYFGAHGPRCAESYRAGFVGAEKGEPFTNYWRSCGAVSEAYVLGWLAGGGDAKAAGRGQADKPTAPPPPGPPRDTPKVKPAAPKPVRPAPARVAVAARVVQGSLFG